MVEVVPGSGNARGVTLQHLRDARVQIQERLVRSLPQLSSAQLGSLMRAAAPNGNHVTLDEATTLMRMVRGVHFYSVARRVPAGLASEVIAEAVRTGQARGAEGRRRMNSALELAKHLPGHPAAKALRHAALFRRMQQAAELTPEAAAQVIGAALRRPGQFTSTHLLAAAKLLGASVLEDSGVDQALDIVSSPLTPWFRQMGLSDARAVDLYRAIDALCRREFHVPLASFKFDAQLKCALLLVVKGWDQEQESAREACNRMGVVSRLGEVTHRDKPSEADFKHSSRR